MYLEKINNTNDIKNIETDKLNILADEIRQFLINSISQTGGHLGSNLGVVELTMALHLSLNLPKDKIIWDVGHQAYTHKLLTGRRDGFGQLRKFGGISGFPKRKESDCDCFDTGHSSTSISAGLGMVAARDLQGKDNTVVAVIGDGSLTGGMAYEALNNAGRLNTNYIIVLNDNNMSISENVGGVSSYLNSIRTQNVYLGMKEEVFQALSEMPKGDKIIEQIRRAKSTVKQILVPGMFFEEMGITYLGPVNGHDIQAMVKVFGEAKRCRGAVLVHVITKKGKGYEPAENHPARFHGAEPFDVETGIPSKIKKKANYTDIFSTVMVKLAEKRKDFVAITAAMPDGTGLKRFRNLFPDRFFDVGIAEQHAVTFAAGLAAGGIHPVVAVYSSFLQRAYDQVLHDVCIQDLPVTFCLDRSGLVGSDGETHQGIFDISYLSSIPGMTIMAPKNKWELSDMIKFSLDYNHPSCIRYPRGEAYDGLEFSRKPVKPGKSEWIYEEEDIVLFALGSMVKTAVEVRKQLKEMGYSCSLVNARFVRPLDTNMLTELAKEHKLLVSMEENVLTGGMGEQIIQFADEANLNIKVLPVALPDEYIEHGNVDVLYHEVGIDPENIVKRIVSKYITVK